MSTQREQADEQARRGEELRINYLRAMNRLDQQDPECRWDVEFAAIREYVHYLRSCPKPKTDAREWWIVYDRLHWDSSVFSDKESAEVYCRVRDEERRRNTPGYKPRADRLVRVREVIGE